VGRETGGASAGESLIDALPPIDLRAVCLVRAISEDE
jgi:hypothetical protein